MTVFTTAVTLLLLRDRSADLAAATAQVADAFDIPKTEVAGRDWLRQLVNREESTARWRSAADLAAVRPPSRPVPQHKTTQVLKAPRPHAADRVGR